MVRNPTRRRTLSRLGTLLLTGASPLAACKPTGDRADAPPPDDSDPEAALHYRYRGIPGGGELYIDADYETNGRSIVYDADGRMFAYGMFSPKNSGTRGYFGDEANGGLPVPRTLRMVRYPENAERNPEGYRSENLQVPMFLGSPLVDVTVPVASRIPDEVLDCIRQYKGGLKLKLRLTRQTLLIGWEVRQGSNYPVARDAQGDRLITDADRMIGGDFCEAQAFNRKINGKWQLVRRKGWQIDPKTGQKIETDF